MGRVRRRSSEGQQLRETRVLLRPDYLLETRWLRTVVGVASVWDGLTQGRARDVSAWEALLSTSPLFCRQRAVRKDSAG
jgi:hypothetical protein